MMRLLATLAVWFAVLTVLAVIVTTTSIFVSLWFMLLFIPGSAVAYWTLELTMRWADDLF